MGFTLVIIYLLFCVLVGILGRDRKLGFIGVFAFSVVLTPLVMALGLVLLGEKQAR